MNIHLIKNILLKFFDVEKAISSKDIFLIWLEKYGSEKIIKNLKIKELRCYSLQYAP